ncbi:cytochrome P450 [Ceratobasidium sp. AG-I]|nr:cytochrome P450 [Ceratobasidium sp. AG-I]
MNITPQQHIALETVLPYATLKNLVYLSGTLIIVEMAHSIYPTIRKLFSPLRQLAGPKNDSLLFGNLRQLFTAQQSSIHEDWLEKYGSTFAFRGFLSAYRLYTVDTRALTFILSQADSFPKPEAVRRSLADSLGEGLIFSEGETHKRQRRTMNPSFGPPQIRGLVPVFWQKSNKLKDIWLDQIKGNPEGSCVIDVLPWLSRATLDIIGVAGFDYHFNSLEGDDQDELAKAFMKVFEAGQQPTMFSRLRNFVPLLKIIPDTNARTDERGQSTMRRIGMKLINEKKSALAQDSKTGSTAQGRDLLTLLIKSNMANESEAQGMSDNEVMAQISTFLAAGHETTSTSTTWALYKLTQYPHIQRKLRRELLECGLGDEPTMSELDKLPYLDNVVRECLRLHPAVPSSVREAACNIQVPVSKIFKDRCGVEHSHITLQKGDTVYIPIVAMNRLKEIWGEDAMEFRPERWDNLPEAAKGMPGVWNHLLTFLHGSRACIGFRFAVIEMKALMYSLVRAIEFDIDPTLEIQGNSTIVTRPSVVSEPEKGNQMPLICKPVLVI